VLAARRLGAERVIALGRHPSRTAIAESFGATDVVPERGEQAIAAVHELTVGEGAPCVIEASAPNSPCTPPSPSRATAARSASWAYPHSAPAGLDLEQMFDRNVGLRGGVAPARAYIPELLEDVLSGDAGPVAGVSTRPWTSPACRTAIRR
jgi:threonine dehydrogenase-like Zn-dependent dehydrogenase